MLSFRDFIPLETPLDATPLLLAVGPPVETATAVGAAAAVEFEFSPGAIGAVVRAGIMPSRFCTVSKINIKDDINI